MLPFHLNRTSPYQASNITPTQALEIIDQMVCASDKGKKIHFSWLQNVSPFFDSMISRGPRSRFTPEMRSRVNGKLHMLAAYITDTNLLEQLHINQKKIDRAFDRAQLAKAISASYLSAAEAFAAAAQNSNSLDLNNQDTLRTIDNAIDAIAYKIYEAEQLLLSKHGEKILELHQQSSRQRSPIDLNTLAQDIRHITQQINKICIDF